MPKQVSLSELVSDDQFNAIKGVQITLRALQDLEEDLKCDFARAGLGKIELAINVLDE